MTEELSETEIQDLKELDLQEMIKKTKINSYNFDDSNFQKLEKFENIEEALKSLTLTDIAKFFYFYANDVIGERFLMGESAIAKDPKYSCLYAMDVIKARFPEGEPEIAKDPYFSYFYARCTIEERFLEGEPAIAKNPELARSYAERFNLPQIPE